MRNQIEKLPLLSNPDGSVTGFSPELCQGRNMLESKLVEVQSKWIETIDGNSFFFFNVACVGGEC